MGPPGSWTCLSGMTPFLSQPQFLLLKGQYFSKETLSAYFVMESLLPKGKHDLWVLPETIGSGRGFGGSVFEDYQIEAEGLPKGSQVATGLKFCSKGGAGIILR